MTVNTKHNKTNINCSTYRCVTELADRITASAHKFNLVPVHTSLERVCTYIHIYIHVYVYIYLTYNSSEYARHFADHNKIYSTFLFNDSRFLEKDLRLTDFARLSFR